MDELVDRRTFPQIVELNLNFLHHIDFRAILRFL